LSGINKYTYHPVKHEKITLLFMLFFGMIQNIPVFSQPADLSADRPGFSTGTHAVTPGRIYLETGYQYNFNKEYNPGFSQLPVLNVRIGIADKTELFIMWDGIDVSHLSRTSGIPGRKEISFPGIGSKYRLLKSDTYNITLIGKLEGNVENNSFSVEPAIALAWDYSLSERFELFGIGQAGYEPISEISSLSTVSAVGIGFLLTDRLNVFSEYFNIAYPGAGKLFNGSEFGITFLLSPGIQLDAYGGLGLTGEMNNYAGAGISRRF
jgi:hypothetical protein